MVRSKSWVKKERMVLFQRYLYTAFSDLIRASHEGAFCDGELFYPRILMLLADQPQERAFFCLKGSGGYRDCSLCMMPFKMPKSGSNDADKSISFESDDEAYSNGELPSQTDDSDSDGKSRKNGERSSGKLPLNNSLKISPNLEMLYQFSRYNCLLRTSTGKAKH